VECGEIGNTIAIYRKAACIFTIYIGDGWRTVQFSSRTRPEIMVVGNEHKISGVGKSGLVSYNVRSDISFSWLLCLLTVPVSDPPHMQVLSRPIFLKLSFFAKIRNTYSFV
jgi:hypothetical protein